MEAFLLLTFSFTRRFTFNQPVLQQVKAALPDLPVMDTDSFSDPSLVNYAVRFLEEAEKPAVLLKVEDPNAALGTCLPVVEALIRHPGPALVLLLGQHRRLQGIFEVRPHITFKTVPDEAAAVTALSGYFRAQPS